MYQVPYNILIRKSVLLKPQEGLTTRKAKYLLYGYGKEINREFSISFSNHFFQKEISNIVYGKTNGVLRCSFSRPASLRKEISGGKKHNFDLVNGLYYILYAVGSANPSGKVNVLCYED